MICPICDKKSDLAYRPFCSKHCADVDLGKWLRERYHLSSAAAPTTDKATPEQQRDPSMLH